MTSCKMPRGGAKAATAIKLVVASAARRKDRGKRGGKKKLRKRRIGAQKANNKIEKSRQTGRKNTHTHYQSMGVRWQLAGFAEN